MLANERSEIIKLRRRLRLASFSIFWWASIVGILGLGIVRFIYFADPVHAPTTRGEETLAFAVEALLEGFLFLVIVEFVFRIISDRETEDTIKETIERTIAGESLETFPRLPKEVQSPIIGRAIEAALNGEYGRILFEEVVEPHFTERSYYREDFDYRISCEDDPPDAELKQQPARDIADHLKSKAPDYLWVTQDLFYLRRGYVEDREMSKLVFKLAFDIALLNELFAEDDVFFREVFTVTPDIRKMIEALNEAELQDFITGYIGFQAYRDQAGGSRLTPQVTWARTPDSGQPYINIEVGNPSGRLEESGCRIYFRLPHLRTSSHFIVTVPQPIMPGAKITFSRSRSMVAMSEIPFISQFAQGRQTGYVRQNDPPRPDPDVGPRKITVETTRWVFPQSGFMFVWRY